MHKIYLFVEKNNNTRKVGVDQPYLFKHKKIRLLKDYFEDGLFLPYSKDSGKVERYYLTRDKILKEDEHHYYFNFPFNFDEVEGIER